MSQAITMPLPADQVGMPLPTDQAGMPLPADPLGAAARQVEQDHRRVLQTRDGRPVAAVVSMEDLAALERLDAAEDAFWTAEANTALARWDADGRPAGTSHDELLARHGIAPESQ